MFGIEKGLTLGRSDQNEILVKLSRTSLNDAVIYTVWVYHYVGIGEFKLDTSLGINVNI